LLYNLIIYLFVLTLIVFFYSETDLKKEKSVKQTIISNRCYIDVAMTFFHKSVIKSLNSEHIRLLASTPFLHLFAFSKGIQVNNAVLHQILLTWNKKSSCFTFKGKDMYLTPEEVSIIMGLGLNSKYFTFNINIIDKHFQK
jgi:hypothetical protein